MNSVLIIKSLPEIISTGRKTEARKLAVRTLEVVPYQVGLDAEMEQVRDKNVYAGKT
jgi:hypothetical protein